MSHAATRLAIVLALAGTMGCNDFLDVESPNVIDVGELDSTDAATFSLSARQDFAQTYGVLVSHSAYFTGEVWPAETSIGETEFALRSVAPTNFNLVGGDPGRQTPVWASLSASLVSNSTVVDRFGGGAARIEVARSALYAGFSWQLMAEMFCVGVTRGGPGLTTAQMLDSAIARFTTAIAQATDVIAGGGTGAPEAGQVQSAAYVGRARAYLQAGNSGAALSDAGQVPADFLLNAAYADVATARLRLGNYQWATTFDRKSLVVAADFRVTDPRVPWAPPEPPTDVGIDGVTPFYKQLKYTSYASPIRLASRLEADYIAAEAGGSTADRLALIDARRAANGQPAYAGPTDDASVLTELMEQRGLDFYLEGKRLGDFRRNPAAVLHIPPTGGTYFKPGFSPIGDQTCWPLPNSETLPNPNF